ncbi:MAG TPA: hypothetical protein VJR27_05775 [Candidatus Saccharimonadales bacterium]|nr:hypothetical protein [Candidatus Saccharimonadales bacterium]
MKMGASQRIWVTMVAVLSLLGIGIIAAAYGANSILQKQSKKLIGYKLQNQVIAQQQTDLVKAKKDIETYAPLNDIAKTVVPQDKDQAEAVREIVNIAAANNITLSSVSFSASTLGGQASGSKSTPLTQVSPVPNIAGVFQLPITIQQDSTHPITYAQFVSFLGALENNRRTAQVSSVNIQPTPDHVKLIFTLQLNEYIKP